MSIIDIREDQARFEPQMERLLKDKKKLYKIRKDFTSYWTPARIRNMTLEQYAIGVDRSNVRHNFCYTLERELDQIGRIIGATSFKFGVYYGRTKTDPEIKYRFTQKYGTSYTEAFENVRTEILRLIEAGFKKDTDEIIRNKLSHMFKGKILSTYFPERYINIFSNDHLTHFLIHLNIDTPKLLKADPVIKRNVLLEYKNNDPMMKNWKVDLFSHFLYHYYPGHPTKKDAKHKPELAKFRNPVFPANPIPMWIEMTIKPPVIKGTRRQNTKTKTNPDYDSEQRQLKKYGDRGEKLVLEMEKDRLETGGRSDLADKVFKVNYDYEGYDVNSFEIDGSPRQIEVKTTLAKKGAAQFYLSINEYNKSQELENYYLYIVFDILSEQPKIWPLPNPFSPQNDAVVRTPVNFRVNINADPV